MDFQPFQRYLTPDAAADIVAMLTAQGVPFELEEDVQPGDGIVTFGQVRPVVLRLLAADFGRVRALLHDHLAVAVAQTQPGDHYLFDFADDELHDIVAAPDEWSPFDYLLAQRLLRERGHGLSARHVAQQARSRHRELARPEPPKPWVIQVGYLLAFAGGVFGILVGRYLAHQHHVMPDGQRVPAFDEETRTHGRRMMLIGTVVWLLVVGGRLLRVVGRF